MKIFKRLSLLGVSTLLLFSFSFASSVSETNKSKVDKIMVMVDRQWGNDDAFSQIARYEKIINSFSKISLNDKDKKEIISYMIECFQQRVNNLKSQVKTQDQVISNVDRNRVKEEWLAWHNYERSQKGLDEYTYNETLNYTSLIWAQQIASEKRKTGSTHARKSGDGYRNTDSIRERFANLGVNVVYFSESNAYGYYNCKKSDCTQEIIDALKKCFNRTFLDRNHYSAVVSSTYDQIGFGVATNGTYLWLTTHYGKNIK